MWTMWTKSGVYGLQVFGFVYMLMGVLTKDNTMWINGITVLIIGTVGQNQLMIKDLREKLEGVNNVAE